MINYTNLGGKIDIQVKEQAGDVIFSVTDNGNGIPKRIFRIYLKDFLKVQTQNARPARV